MRSTNMLLCSPAAALVFLAAVGATAQTQTAPLKGTLEARDTGQLQGGTVVVTGKGSGIASMVGRFTYTYTTTINLATSQGSGVIELVAANGDVISGSLVGRAEPSGTPNISHAVELVTITGGTGRFQGATGSFMIDRLADETNIPAFSLTSGTLKGRISTPGSAK